MEHLTQPFEFDDVSLENPEVAAKIPYPRMEAIMRHRRQKTTPINPTNFAQCVELLQGAPTYNKHLQHVILEDDEGALLFATTKGLALANSEEVKVTMIERLMQSFSHVVTVSALHVEIFLDSRISHATSAGGKIRSVQRFYLNSILLP